MTGVLLFFCFVILIAMSVPIAFGAGVASIVSLVASGTPLTAAVQRMFTAADSFSLLAIPLFMLAGKLMEFGGVSRRLVRVANDFVGHVHGGLGIVSILSCMFFGAISGSSTGTVAAVGSVMLPAMIESGYDKRFAAALIATAGSLGILIPPSIPLIIYGVVTGASISDLFIAGILVGIVAGVMLSLYVYFVARARGYRGSDSKTSLQNLIQDLIDATPALLMPLIILGGIYGGLFTPTEAAAVACVYGFVVGLFVYKEYTLKDLPSMLLEATKNTAVVMFIICTSSLLGWILTLHMMPQLIASVIMSLSANLVVVMCLIIVFLIFVGTFIEGNAFVIILAPLFMPMVASMGVHPVQFGALMCSAVCVGTITPPLGVNLFTTCGIFPVTIEELCREIGPFVLIMCILLFIVAFWPPLSLFLVNLVH